MNILKFQEIHNAIRVSEGDEIRTAYNVVSVITGTPADEYRKMKWADFLKVQKDVTIPDMNIKTDEWVKEFDCQGEKFKVIQFATDWNGEQFISMTTLTKDEFSIIDNLHLILAVLCVKEVGEDISLTEYNRRAELFQNHLDVNIAYPIGFFFAAFLAKLSGTTRYSFHLWKKKRELKRLQRKAKRIGLQQNGGGMLRWIKFWLKE
jgi:hypothetical protein